MTRSPDRLDNPTGVRRLNRMPLVIAGMMMMLIIGAVTYTYQTRLARMREQAAKATAKPTAANPAEVFRDAPDGGYIPARKAATPAPKPPSPPVEPEKKAAAKAPEPDPEQERLRRQRARLRRMREQAALAAIRAPTRINGQSHHKPAAAKAQAAAEPPAVRGQIASLIAAEAKRRAGGENGTRDLNRAAEKAAWLNGRQQTVGNAHYLPGGREAPHSPYEVKAGTVIPAIMVGGINSDLPGQIIGQTAENVYDTATGRYILIPQGSKLVGTYHNAITTGQERVLIAWTRIIYPDASSVDLGKMPGADSAGFAGLHDQVNTHFWKKFSSALMLSAISAGVQLSQTGGRSSTGTGTDAQQTIAASLGQQLGQLGMETARRNSRIQPTIEIRPGLRFTVMVTKDMSLNPWRAE